MMSIRLILSDGHISALGNIKSFKFIGEDTSFKLINLMKNKIMSYLVILNGPFSFKNF
jgi:hypothetical protein